MKIGTMLKEIRAAMKWSREELTRHLGDAPPCLSSVKGWERGDHRPMRAMVLRIEKLYEKLIVGKK